MRLNFSPVNYVFGSPGSGKTTVLAKFSRFFNKKGVKVCANFPLSGTYTIKDEDVGHYNFSGGVLLLDECGISYSNRDFKKGLMSEQARLQYWKLVRHYHCMIIVASQSWEDVDKKIRDLSQSYFLIKRSLLPCFTTIKPIFKKVDIDKLTHQPADMFIIGGLFSWSWCFRKRYYKYFNSYDAPPLPDYDYESHYVP